ncbi:MAG TPA: hypothetical protein VFC73_05000 [Syntrophomonadaceae bacterium]|nr:hypothetical protein [Syntrophomonadaceae bacterium]
MSKILFSTLGMTDPIKNDYDGPLLHIMRKYKPEQVYLFMTKRICELADEDDRYRLQIEYLCAKEEFTCEIIERRYEDIDNPQEYDIFYPIFEEELNHIHLNNPKAQILINLSSGTPQMKSTCHLLALTAPFPIIPLQVTTPNEGENYGSPDYDIQETWDNNMDNHTDLGIKNRTSQVNAENLRFLISREAAISNIKAYNYTAALEIIMSVEEFVSPNIIILLNAAVYRKNMQLREAEREVRLTEFNLFPIKSGDAKELFEYLLILGLQQKTGQLIDFVRGISPALSRLFEAFLEEKCNRKVKEDYCTRSYTDPNHWRLKRDKIRAKDPELLRYYDSKYDNAFRDSDISCSSLLPMIEYDCGAGGSSPNEAVIMRVQKMRAVEKNLRNPAAHNITAVKEEQFVKLASISSERLLTDMQWLFRLTYSRYFPREGDLWESYEIMNAKIIELLMFE